MEDETELPTAKVRTDDWDPDRFPTSALPVYKRIGLLAALIFGLCSVAYYTSEHPEEEIRETNKFQVEERFLSEEQIEQHLAF